MLTSFDRHLSFERRFSFSRRIQHFEPYHCHERLLHCINGDTALTCADSAPRVRLPTPPRGVARWQQCGHRSHRVAKKNECHPLRGRNVFLHRGPLANPVRRAPPEKTLARTHQPTGPPALPKPPTAPPRVEGKIPAPPKRSPPPLNSSGEPKNKTTSKNTSRAPSRNRVLEPSNSTNLCPSRTDPRPFSRSTSTSVLRRYRNHNERFSPP